MTYGLYIHWPFCRGKCPYCGFVSYTGRERHMERYATALGREMEMRRDGVFSGDPFTVYFGGGTPSIAPEPLIRELLRRICITAETEFTIEANPESISAPWLEAVRQVGANRISVGVQSFNDRLLTELGRLHTSKRAAQAVQDSKNAGFKNISIDLMFGVPGQSIEQWEQTLDIALDLEVNHISGYSLGVEEDAPFFESARQEGLQLADPVETSEMYALMADMLRRQGYIRYEISNFALPGFECRHNMGYWNFIPYLGVGASAHSFDGKKRWWNAQGLNQYIKCCACGIKPTAGEETLDMRMREIETLMLSLRTAKGLTPEHRREWSFFTQSEVMSKLRAMEREGLIAFVPEGNIALTDRGIMIADEILSELALKIEEIKNENGAF